MLRAVDDNRLTSWLWAFSSVNITSFLLIMVLGIIFAYILTWFWAKISFPTTTQKFSSSLFLFLVSFAAVMPFWRVPEVIVDVSRYFTQAKHLSVYGIGYFIREWGRDINIWTDMPLISFIYGLIFKFFGESRAFIQAFTTFLFSMTVVLTYNIGKTLWNETVGFYGALLLLGIPYLFSQIPLMLVDVPTMFFLTLAVFAFIKALKHGGSWVLISSIAIFLAFFSKYSTWLMLSVLPVIFAVYLHSVRNSSESLIPVAEQGGIISNGLNSQRILFYRCAAIAALSVLLIGMIFLYKFDVFSEQLRLLMTFQKPGLRRWEESFVSTFFFQIHPFITAFAVYSAYAAFRKRELKYAVISCLIILILLLQIKRIRYIVMAFPMLTLMASYGLQEIRDKDIRKFIVLCIVISSLTIGIFAYLPFLQKISTVNLKHAGEFLYSIDEKNIEVFAMPQKEPDINPAVSVPVLDLFTKKRITYHYDKGLYPLLEDFERSPLRFTWEYRNPEYYTAESENEKKALLLIINDVEQKLPDYIEQRIKFYSRSKVFKTWEGVFSYKTVVVVYY
jgi:hypothetical protein